MANICKTFSTHVNVLPTFMYINCIYVKTCVLFPFEAEKRKSTHLASVVRHSALLHRMHLDDVSYRTFSIVAAELAAQTVL